MFQADCSNSTRRLRRHPMAVLVFALLPALVGAQQPAGQRLVIDSEHAAAEITALEPINAYRQRGDSALAGHANQNSRYRVELPLAELGYYRVFAMWPAVAADSDPARAKYRLRAGSQQVETTLDQSGLPGDWHLIGEIGALDSMTLELTVSAAAGHSVLVDAFRLQYVGAATPFSIETDLLPLAVAGEHYAAELQASTGATVPLQWRVIPSLPRGLVLDAATGRISGAAQDSGSFTVTLQVTDPQGRVASQTLSLEVLAAAVSLQRAPTMNTIQDAADAPGRPQGPGTATTKLASLPETIQTYSGQSPLLDTVAGMAEGSWSQLSLNRYDSVWSPPELRPLKGAGNPPPKRIILPWSSFAWDDAEGDLYLYGGGHANYPGNDVYIWRSSTRQWERGSLPSDIVRDDFNNWTAKDGVMAAPTSAHTYDNNVFLPVSRRFITYGGAVYGTGGSFMRQIDQQTQRPTGPYVFNPLLADGSKVGGTTGSHVQREGPFPEVVGGNMWQNRDLYGIAALAGSLPVRHLVGTTDIAVENGKDVVYVSASAGGTAQNLFRHTINDINNPALDEWVRIGSFGGGFTGQGAGAMDPVRNLYVRNSKFTFLYWNLNTAGSGNPSVTFTPEDTSGEFVYSDKYGIDYSPLHNTFFMWEGFGDVWRLQPPAIPGATGWTISKDSDGGAVAPNLGPNTGILGKWKFAPSLNAFIGLQDADAGNIWVYKPVGWQAPTPPQPELTVALDSPTAGAQFASGSDVEIAASATDPLGSIDRVAFFANQQLLAEDTTAPYSFVWSAPADGDYTLQATVFSSSGATADAQAVSVRVGIPNQPPTVSWLQPGAGTSWPQGQVLQLVAAADDPDGSIESVAFYADDVLLGTDTSAPYQWSWTATPIGEVQLTATAIDNVGDEASSNLNLTVVSNNQPPQVSLTQPLDGAAYTEGDNVVFEALATDNDGSVQRVEFYANGSLLAEDSSAPFTFTWSAVAAGSYSLFARAVDDEGAETDSAAASISVSPVGGGSLVLLQDGNDQYSGSADTRITSWKVNRNYGAETAVFDQSGRYATLVRFAIFNSEGGPVPDGATIQSATLSLYKYNDFNHSYALHRMLASWDESEATWNESRAGVPWASPGALAAGTDFAAQADATASSDWGPRWLDLDVTAAVQDFSFGSSNSGWRLLPTGGNRNIKRFYSREFQGDPALRPKLQISYAFGGNVAPSVTLGSPTDGSSFEEGEAITLSATASDADGSVARVEFYADGQLLATDDSAPFAYQWLSAPAGNIELSATAVDNEGASTASTPVTISVLSNNEPPSVTLVNPSDGATFTTAATIVLEALAADPDGSVQRVDFYANGTLLNSDTAAPYTFSWSGAAAGGYTLLARVIDDEGASADSETATITVTLPGGGGEVVLQQGIGGYAGTIDARITSWKVDRNYGDENALFDQAGKYASLLRFAIFAAEGGPVPDGATIVSATLGLYKYRDFNHNYALQRLLVSWDESEVTWNESRSGIPWTVPGAAGGDTDYQLTPDGTGESPWGTGWLEIDVTGALQDFAGGASNHGWRLLPTGGNRNIKRFYSSEYVTAPELRPRLIITYN